MQKKRTSGRKRTLSLEHLEPRILLSVVNPGEPSLLYGGDTLYFVQGEAPVGDPVPPYSDQGGTPSQVVIVDFEGTGYVTIQDSLGHSYLEGIENGAKIGNISFYGVTEDSSLYIRTGEFRQDHGLDDLPAGMADAPDTSDDAWGLAVPGGDETYNTGRRVVASLGSLSPDWYKFSAEEAERIVVNSDGLYNVDIYVNGLWRATNSYTIGDLDGDEAVDSVEVLLRVLPTGKYVLEVDRVEQTVDWDGDGTPENEAATEDFPDDLAIVTVEGFPELFYRQDLTSRMPMFNLHGEGPGDDYFSVKLAPYQTLAAEDFSPGVASVQVLHKDGWVLQDLITGDYTPSAETTVYLKVESSGAWNFDLEVKPRPLETIVQLVRDQYTGRYVWWNASATPWMNSYYSGGVEVPVSAPAGSGGAVVTGNITFDNTSTGFGTLAIDGSLKGSVGVWGATLDFGETINEIRVGYINGSEGGTTGGVRTDGNVNRILVQSTVAEMEDPEVNRIGASDRWGPADFYVGGYLMDFQAAGTIFADIEVGGDCVLESPIFAEELESYDYEAMIAEGFNNDAQDGATVVGSVTGDFAVEGRVYYGYGIPTGGKQDPQDWYVFTAGLGQEITVDMATGFTSCWAYAPSGRLMALVELGEPATFVADEAGAYYVAVGKPRDGAHDPGLPFWTGYRIEVSGTSPVALGGIVVGSHAFGEDRAAAVQASTGTLEFGDDISDTYVSVGDVWGGSGFASLGLVHVKGEGNYADVTLWTTGSVGHIKSYTAATDDGDYAEFDVGGDLNGIHIDGGDLQFNYMYVGGNLGEIVVTGDIESSFAGETIRVLGHVGAVVAGDDFYAGLSIYTDGIDLLWVGDDFGGPTFDSSLDTAPGVDVGFAYVAGDIYDEGDKVQSVFVRNTTEHFTDDGGADIYLTPGVTQYTEEELEEQDGEEVEPEPPMLEYRYLPVGAPGGGPVGAVITEIITDDSVFIRVAGGQADIGVVNFGNKDMSYLKVIGLDRQAELDIYRVQVQPEVEDVRLIGNYSHQGDIVNITAGSVREIFAAGHIGLTERFASEAGRLPNPLLEDEGEEDGGFVPPEVSSVAEANPAYFNGVLIAGDLGRIQAYGSIGDVYVFGNEGGDGADPVPGNVGLYSADADHVSNGSAFSIRGMRRLDREWDGVAGVLYASGDVGYADPGDGIYGGVGEYPIGGIFSAGRIGLVSATDSLIQGPIFGSQGIGTIYGNRTVISDTVIGAGADYSDWRLWEFMRLTTEGMRLDNLHLVGLGSEIDGAIIQVGVLGSLYMGPGTNGVNNTWIHAMGDNDTEEGINTIAILGGGIGNTWIDTPQRIGHIALRGHDVDMTDVDIRSLKSIEGISVQGDIVFNTVMDITAPLYINYIVADNMRGPGVANINAGRLGRIVARGIFEANVNVDGPVGLVQSGGEFSGSFTARGPHGEITSFVTGQALSGSVDASNYIGRLLVLNGDVTGNISAGGSDETNTAIGRIFVRNGDLVGDVTVVDNDETQRPGGGIGGIYVRGDLWGDVLATSYFDILTDSLVPAGIGVISVAGTLYGDVTIQRGDAGEPQDLGGTLRNLTVVGGDIEGDVNVYGDIGLLCVKGGALNGDVNVDGSNIGRLVVVADGTDAVTGDIDVEGNLNIMQVVGGDVTGDINVDGLFGRLVMGANADMLGAVSAGEIGSLLLYGPNGVQGSIHALGDLGLLKSLHGVAASVTVEGSAGQVLTYEGTDVSGTITLGGVGLLYSRGDVLGDVDIAGDVGTFQIVGGDLVGDLTIHSHVCLLSLTGGGVLGDIDISGDVHTFTVRNPGQDAVQGQIFVDDSITRAVFVGDVVGELTVGDGGPGDGIGSMSLYGDLESELTVEGSVSSLYIIGGRVTSNGNPLDPRVEVAGNVGYLKVFGFAGAGVVIEDEISVGDRLGYMSVSNGDFNGTLDAGSIGALYYFTPNGVTAAITSAGNLDLLYVAFGPIQAPVDVFHHIGSVVALEGVTEDGDITVGSGFPGAGMDSLYVTGGDMRGDLVVTGDLGRVTLRGHLVESLLEVTAGSFSELTVLGNVLDANVSALDGLLENTYVGGSYTGTNVDAAMLGRVTVRGRITGTGEIHADVGTFTVSEAGVLYEIEDLVGHWFENVHAYVG